MGAAIASGVLRFWRTDGAAAYFGRCRSVEAARAKGLVLALTDSLPMTSESTSALHWPTGDMDIDGPEERRVQMRGVAEATSRVSIGSRSQPMGSSRSATAVWVDRGLACSPRLNSRICFAAISRTATLALAEDAKVFLLVLRGAAHVESRNGRFWLPRKRWLAFDKRARPVVTTAGKTLALALLIPAEGEHAGLSGIFSGQGTFSREQGRVALAAWRDALGEVERGIDPQRAVLRTSHLLMALQDDLRCLASRCPGRTEEQRGRVLERLQRTMLILEGTMQQPASLVELASLCSLSPSHFAKTFKKVYGLGPREATAALKLRLASELLLNTDRAVGDIGHRCGFQSPSTFARAFRERFGLSASAFRHARRYPVTRTPAR